MRERLLRLLLFTAAFAWGVSVIGVFLPWDFAVTALRGLGAGPIPDDPMLCYWLRMASGAFYGVGVFLLIVAVRPRAFASVIPIAGGLMFLEGILLAVAGTMLHLRPLPFWADTACCLFVGGGIVVLSIGSKKIKHGTSHGQLEGEASAEPQEWGVPEKAPDRSFAGGSKV